MKNSFLAVILTPTLACFAVVALAGCAHSTGLRGDESELRKAVAAKIPPGTPVEFALKSMKSAGYRCSAEAVNSNNIICTATSFMRDVDWRVRFTVRDGLVETSVVDRWVTFL